MSMEKRSTALVIKSTGSWYVLRDVRSGRPLAGRIRGSLRLRGSRSTNPVVVGDRVEYETADDGTAAIVGVCPRSNYIIPRTCRKSRISSRRTSIRLSWSCRCTARPRTTSSSTAFW